MGATLQKQKNKAYGRRVWAHLRAHFRALCVSHHRPHMGPNGPEWAQNGPRMGPKWGPTGPHTDAARQGVRGSIRWDPKRLHVDPKWAPNGPHMDPKGPRMDFKWAPKQPRMSHHGPNVDSKRSQRHCMSHHGFKWAPKRHQFGPKEALTACLLVVDCAFAADPCHVLQPTIAMLRRYMGSIMGP